MGRSHEVARIGELERLMRPGPTPYLLSGIGQFLNHTIRALAFEDRRTAYLEPDIRSGCNGSVAADGGTDQD